MPVDPMKQARLEEVKAMLKNLPDVDSSQETIVAFDQFADSSLNLILQVFCKTTKLVPFHAVKEEILLKIADIIARNGAELAFPTRTLYLNQTSA